jgi:hypothetical protein
MTPPVPTTDRYYRTRHSHRIKCRCFLYTQLSTMPPPKRERGGRSLCGAMGRARRAPAYVCPNPLCKEVLPASQSGLTNHFLHFTTCSNVNPSVLSILQDTQKANTDRETSLARAASELDPCVHSDSEEATDYRFDLSKTTRKTKRSLKL